MTTEQEEFENEQEDIAVRIKHILGIWPIISPTMLQAALGPQIKSDSWRPVLEDMITHGVVKQETLTRKSPANRHLDYQRLMLVE